MRPSLPYAKTVSCECVEEHDATRASLRVTVRSDDWQKRALVPQRVPCDLFCYVADRLFA